MVQGPEFLYFFRTENKTSFYYVDQFGTVQTTTTPTPLQYSPNSWAEISLHTERNKKYFGLDRSFTIPLDFVEDGATILKHVYYTKGIEGKLDLLILEQKLFIDATQYGFYYEIIYNGEPDLSTFLHDGVKVTCSLVEGGIPKLLKANENTPYEIDIDIPEAVTVKMDGLNIKGGSNYVTISEFHIAARPTFSIGLRWLQVQFAANEGTIFDTEQQSTTPITERFTNTQFDDNFFPNNYFFKANTAVIITLKIKTKVRLVNGSYVRLYVKNSSGARNILFTLVGNNSALGEQVEMSYDIQQNFTLAAGQKLFLISEFFDISDPSGGALYFDGEISILYTSRYKTTYVKGLRLSTLYRELVRKMIGADVSVSDILQGRPDLVVMSGDSLRGFLKPKVKTTFNDFWQTANSLMNIGMGVLNGKLRLEAKDYWLVGPVVSLGEVSNLKVSSANDFIYNVIKSGSPDQQYDNVNGRDEPNTTFVWSTPLTRVVKDYNLVSSYRLDMYGIEFTRINFEGKRTTDSSSDNDTFVAQVLPAGIIQNVNGTDTIVHELDRTVNAGATGILDPASAFNLGLSPKRILLTHGWFLHSFLDNLDNQWIKFQSTDKNAEMVSNTIIEKDDVMIGYLPDKKFLPVLMEFETKVPENFQQLLNDNPVRVYEFTYGGNTFKGIAMKTGIEPSTNKSQTFQMLSTADNDLSKLIEFNE